jgi:TolB-like protein/DNA-binding winged helix-turn-helix (wHTH) protein/Tfp pilus assembly protein PilF
MSLERQSSAILRFGVFEVDVRAGELRKQGVRIKLQEQPFQVLTTLLRRRGDVVTREELRAQLWQSDTFVDFDNGLNTSINKLREALGDSADNPRFVETLPRRGYRFLAPVSDDHSRELTTAVTQWKNILPVTVLAVVAASIAIGLLWRGHTLRRVRPPQIESLAVLPLLNLSGDPQQEYFADGMTDELTTTLSRISVLRVTSRTSAMEFKGTKKTVAEIAKELNVDALVEGSVTRSGNRVRVTAQLIEARTDSHLWANEYERDLRDALTLQDEVARDIANEIRVKLTPEERTRLAAARPIDPETNEAYLKGRYYYSKLSAEGFKEALKCYQLAVARDANYAPAYVGIGASYEGLGIWEQLAPEEAASKSRAALEKALTLDDTLGEAHAILGHIHFLWDWDWAGAEREYKRALEVGPPSSMIKIRYAIFLVSMGRKAEAIEQIKEAHVIDPVSLMSNNLFGFIYYLSHDFDQAIDQYRKTLTLYPDAENAHLYLSRSYEQRGMYLQAFREYPREERFTGTTEAAAAAQQQVFEKSGWRGFWQKELEAALEESRREYVSSELIAEIYARLGEKDKALASLEKAYRERSHNMAFIKVEPTLGSLQPDPRFQAILRRMNLPQ